MTGGSPGKSKKASMYAGLASNIRDDFSSSDETYAPSAVAASKFAKAYYTAKAGKAQSRHDRKYKEKTRAYVEKAEADIRAENERERQDKLDKESRDRQFRTEQALTKIQAQDSMLNKRLKSQKEMQNERIGSQKEMLSTKIGAQKGMQDERLRAQRDIYEDKAARQDYQFGTKLKHQKAMQDERIGAQKSLWHDKAQHQDSMQEKRFAHQKGMSNDKMQFQKERDEYKAGNQSEMLDRRLRMQKALSDSRLGQQKELHTQKLNQQKEMFDTKTGIQQHQFETKRSDKQSQDARRYQHAYGMEDTRHKNRMTEIAYREKVKPPKPVKVARTAARRGRGSGRRPAPSMQERTENQLLKEKVSKVTNMPHNVQREIINNPQKYDQYTRQGQIEAERRRDSWLKDIPFIGKSLNNAFGEEKPTGKYVWKSKPQTTNYGNTTVTSGVVTRVGKALNKLNQQPAGRKPVANRTPAKKRPVQQKKRSNKVSNKDLAGY
jgi:hypothetical protein